MHLQEFKAWFEGYTEAMKGAPSEKQWARIKEQVKKIDGTWYYSWPQYTHTYDRYLPVWPTYYATGSVQNDGGANAAQMSMTPAYQAGQTDAKEAA